MERNNWLAKVRGAVVTVVKISRKSFLPESSHEPVQLMAGTYFLPVTMFHSTEFHHNLAAFPPSLSLRIPRTLTNLSSPHRTVP